MMSKFLINFARLTRPLSNVKNIALVLLAFYLSRQEFDLIRFILGILSLSFVCSAIYAYNGLCDQDFDRQNKNKQHYRDAVYYFESKHVFIIALFLALLGLFLGFYFNIYFLISLMALLVAGFLYSSKYTRFKEKALLDVLFGAVFPFAFRFLAAWFVFADSFSGSDTGLTPVLALAILALVFAKTGGYLLYKEADRAYMQVNNSITLLKKQTVILLSVLCWIAAIILFVFICLNSQFLGPNFLFFIIFAVPPLLVIYFLVLGKIKIEIKYLRILGFAYWILAIIIAVLFL